MDKSIFQTYIEQAELKDLLQFEAYQDEVVRAQPANEATTIFANYTLPEAIVAYLDFDHSLYMRDTTQQTADAKEQALYQAAVQCFISEKKKLIAQLANLL